MYSYNHCVNLPSSKKKSLQFLACYFQIWKVKEWHFPSLPSTLRCNRYGFGDHIRPHQVFGSLGVSTTLKEMSSHRPVSETLITPEWVLPSANVQKGIASTPASTHLSHTKKTLTFHWILVVWIGIPIMVYYHPHPYVGLYDPLKQPGARPFFA